MVLYSLIEHNIDMKKRRVLITGGAGFIGSHLAEKLVNTGCEVVALDNFFCGNRDNVGSLLGNPSFELIGHDMTTPFYREVDEIYNLACLWSPTHYSRDPVTTLKGSLLGAMNTLDLAKRLGARVLQSSSSKVYGTAEVTPTPEDYWGKTDPVGKRCAYEEGKRASEALCMAYRRQYGVDVRIGRLYNIYGPRMPSSDGRLIAYLITSALRGDDIIIQGDGSAERTFLYIEDAVDALTLLMEHAGRNIPPINIGSSDRVRVDDLARMILDLTNSRSKIKFLHRADLGVHVSEPHLGRSRDMLNWKARVSLSEGLISTIRHFESVLRRDRNSVTNPHMSWVEMA